MAEEETAYNIPKEKFWTRLELLHQSWTNRQPGDDWHGCDSLLICCGKGDDLTDKKNNTIHLWLFGFQLLSTIMIITPDIVLICAGEKTVQILKQLGTTHNNNDKLKLELIIKDKSDQYQKNYTQLIDVLKNSNQGKMIGYCEEQQKGKFIENFLNLVNPTNANANANGNANANDDNSNNVSNNNEDIPSNNINNNFSIIHFSSALSSIMMAKDNKEIETMKNVGEFTSAVMNFCVSKIEKIVEKDESISHSDLSNKLSIVVDDPRKVKSNLRKENLDTAYDPIIQSGGNFKLKIRCSSDDNELYYNGGCVVIMMGYRLRDYCSNIARTLYFDASNDQKKIYSILVKCFKKGLITLRNNVELHKVYEACLRAIEKSDMPQLRNHFLKECGWGIGLEIKDKNYAIDKKNTRVAKTGMVFYFQVGFKNLIDKSKEKLGEKASKYSIIIGDTVVVTDGQIEWCTKYDRKMLDYEVAEPENTNNNNNNNVLNEDEKESKKDGKKSSKNKKSKKKSSHNNENNNDNNINDNVDDNSEGEEEIDNDLKLQAQQGRRYVTRNSNAQAQARRAENEKSRKDREIKQEKLRDIKRQRLEKLLSDTGGSLLNNDDSTEYKDPNCYKESNEMPSSLELSKVYVDPTHECIICPIFDHMVPFHINTLKNYSISQSNDSQLLRLNFITPIANNNNRRQVKQPEVAMKHSDSMYVKELTYRSIGNNLQNVSNDIRSLQKNLKLKLKQQNQAPLVKQDKLKRGIHNNKIFILKDLSCKPSMGGRKKNTGRLECHANGLRYIDHKKNEVHILFNNVKKAFMQPAQNTPAVIIHFHLKNAIMIGKKPTFEVQCYRDVIDRFEDIGRSNYDYDGIAAEKEERNRIIRTNKQFKDYVSNVEKVGKENGFDIEFDIPEMDLVFEGVPNKAKVRMYPTTHCLVALEDNPPFVLCTDDVELAHFERVDFSLKSFDLVFVFKDFTKEAIRIATIPREHIDTLQDFLNWRNVMFSQGKSNLAWKEIMTTIRGDLEKFVENGGWDFLREEERRHIGRPKDSSNGKSSKKKKKGSKSPSKSQSYGADDDYYYQDSASEWEPSEEEYNSGNNDSDDDDDGTGDSDEEEDDFEYSDDDEEGDGGYDDEDDEEGLDWEELDKRAAQADRKSRVKERNDEFVDSRQNGRAPKRQRRR